VSPSSSAVSAGATADETVVSDTPAGFSIAALGASPPVKSSQGGTVGPRAPAGLGATDRGVTKESVLLGWLAIDESAMAQGASFGMTTPSYPGGDFLEPFVKEVNAAGGINGRKLSAQVVTYNPLSMDDMQSACVKLGEDLKVFGAVTPFGYYGDAQVCLASKEIPTVTMNPASVDTLYRREKGWIRLTVMSKDRMLKNWVDWAVTSGLASGSKKIGVWWQDVPEDQAVVNDVLLPYMKSRGLNVASTFVFSSDNTRAPVESTSAVLRFKSANVDVVWPVGNYFVNTFFLTQAKAQDFHPKYTASDFAQLSLDTTSSGYETSQWDGTKAVTVLLTGEMAAGKPTRSSGKECLDVHAKFGGKPLQNNADRDYLMFTCEHLALWVKAARQAGANLTRKGFLAEIDSLGTYADRVAISDPLTYRKGKYDGADRYAVVEWRKECTCYHQVEAFRAGRW